MNRRAELQKLEARKAILQARMAQQRYSCLQAAAEVAPPLGRIDAGIHALRQLAPAAALALPLVLFLLGRRSPGGRRRWTSAVPATLPLVLRGVQLGRQLRAARAWRSAAQSEG